MTVYSYVKYALPWLGKTDTEYIHAQMLPNVLWSFLRGAL